MTQEEKQFLLKDLSARLPYGVKCKVNFDDGISDVMKLSQFPDGLGIWEFYKEGCCGRTDDFKPYLRSMSSMTEEELFNYKHLDLLNYSNDGFEMPNFHSIDWLNEHHFDYRGLIPMGLALEAPEGMYKQ